MAQSLAQHQIPEQHAGDGSRRDEAPGRAPEAISPHVAKALAAAAAARKRTARIRAETGAEPESPAPARWRPLSRGPAEPARREDQPPASAAASQPDLAAEAPGPAPEPPHVRATVEETARREAGGEGEETVGDAGPQALFPHAETSPASETLAIPTPDLAAHTIEEAAAVAIEKAPIAPAEPSAGRDDTPAGDGAQADDAAADEGPVAPARAADRFEAISPPPAGRPRFSRTLEALQSHPPVGFAAEIPPSPPGESPGRRLRPRQAALSFAPSRDEPAEPRLFRPHPRTAAPAGDVPTGSRGADEILERRRVRAAPPGVSPRNVDVAGAEKLFAHRPKGSDHPAAAAAAEASAGPAGRWDRSGAAMPEGAAGRRSARSETGRRARRAPVDETAPAPDTAGAAPAEAPAPRAGFARRAARIAWGTVRGSFSFLLGLLIGIMILDALRDQQVMSVVRSIWLMQPLELRTIERVLPVELPPLADDSGTGGPLEEGDAMTEDMPEAVALSAAVPAPGAAPIAKASRVPASIGPSASASPPRSVSAQLPAATAPRQAEPDLATAIANGRAAAADDRGLARLVAAVERDGESWIALYDLGHAMQRRGDFATAAAMYRRAAALNPDLPAITYDLGYALQRQGDDAGAIAQYERTLASDPEHGYALFNLGALLQRNGRPEDAVRYFERASRVLSSNPYLFYAWGRTLEEVGRPEEAFAAYRRVVELSPNRGRGPDAQVHIERLRAAGHTARAPDADAGLRRISSP